MSNLTVNDLKVKDQRVLVRVDYNVPMEEKDGHMIINDATRIKETLPTLRLLIEKGAKIVLAAHLGHDALAYVLGNIDHGIQLVYGPASNVSNPACGGASIANPTRFAPESFEIRVASAGAVAYR